MPPETARPLELRFTGGGGPRVTLDGEEFAATLRPAEILTALALHPDGLSGEQLTLMLYGEDGNPTTLRGEIHRLRSSLGAELLLTRPYRLATGPQADFLRVRDALRDGRVSEALDSCHGELLPRSDAPAVRELRDELLVGAAARGARLGRRRAPAPLRRAPAGDRRPGGARAAAGPARPGRPAPRRRRRAGAEHLRD
ncbi:hypothetical protein [Pseudonocardia sp. ICBG601]|uniref:hypothetical protein n=1 Tax=Pseudonocardia sp. ICBG601 TaxID=2846759 RepID=UPI001CF6083E|nr:hypothetical protein [Pseudonocardia sp. ICBG601]